MLISHTIFCEGHEQSLDARALNRVKGSTGFVVRALGSKFSMPAYIEGFSSGGSVCYIGIRDRDFDFEPPRSGPCLIKAHRAKPIYAWYRTEVENYLLDARVILEFWKYLAAKQGVRVGAPPDSPQDVEDMLRASAREIRNYEAARWTLCQLKPADRWPELPTTWVRPFSLPTDLSWTACMKGISALIQDYRNKTSTVSVQNAKRVLRDYVAKFAKSSFIEQDAHRLWFGGKDLLCSFSRRAGWGLRLCKGYLEFAVQKVRLDAFAEVKELRNMLQAMAEGKELG